MCPDSYSASESSVTKQPKAGVVDPKELTKPNILFILCDDLGWRDLGCYGSTFYETPRLDRLAQEGMLFTQAYASAPVCSPTRASVLTGKYPASLGITQYLGGHNVGHLCDVPYFDRLPQSEHVLSSALRDAAKYQTWHVGKWHLGPQEAWPKRRGFDVNIGGCDMGAPLHGYFSPWKIPTLTDGPNGEYLTDRLADEAVKLIEHRDPSRPFFLNFWPYAVHTPLQAPEYLVEKYRKKAKNLGLDKEPGVEEGENLAVLAHKDTKIQRRKIQSHPAYAAMVENLDTNIGKLMDALDREGLADNTIVVFTSDNGGLSSAEGSPTCNAPLAEGKGWMYDGGTREPLIVRWPGVVKAGVTNSQDITTTPDFYPTFLEIAKVAADPRQHIDGVSILPALRGEPFDRGPIFWHYPHYSNQGGRPGSAIRLGKWKLIEFLEDGRVELYDLDSDVSEAKDRAQSEPEIRENLHGLLKNWRKSVEAMIPKKNPFWPPPEK